MKNKKAFTLIELIITVTIISILSWISYVSLNMISESNIKNKWEDILTFINDKKSEIIKNNETILYLIMSSSWLKNNYCFSYLEENNCDNIDLENLYDSYFLDDEWFSYFSWAVLDNIDYINIEQKKWNINYEKINPIDNYYAHDTKEWNIFKYSIYWTWNIIVEWQINDVILKCWEIEVFYYSDWMKNKYVLWDIWVYDKVKLSFIDTIILRYSNNSLKPELFYDFDYNRLFFQKIVLYLSDKIDNLTYEIDIN